jgi:hypothetical protein
MITLKRCGMEFVEKKPEPLAEIRGLIQSAVLQSRIARENTENVLCWSRRFDEAELKLAKNASDTAIEKLDRATDLLMEYQLRTGTR